MEEVTRVTTTKKSNKLVTTLLIIAGILGLALIGAAVYFDMIKPSTEKPEDVSKTCACYYVDPAVTTECGDPRKGFLFKLVTSKGDTSCQSACQTSSLPIDDIDSNTKQELFLTCSLPNIQDIRCSEMTIKNKAGELVVGNIAKDDEITLEAKFDKKYNNPTFKINNVNEEPDTISEDGLTIKKTLSQFKTTTIDIVATAIGDDGESINSPLCKRIIEIEQQGESSVTGLLMSRRNTEETTKISEAILRVSNITDTKDIKISFSFDNEEFAKLEMIKGFSLDTNKGEFSIIEQDLYNPENFSQAVSFSQLDDYVGQLGITAELFRLGASLGEASTTVTFQEPGAEEIPPVKEEQPTLESSFSISLATNINCLERVEPNNSIIFTVNIKNNSTSSQSVLKVKNKLPLGFTYIPSSTKINNVSVSDNNYLQSKQVGETTELSWTIASGWNISANQSLVVVFQAIAGPNALTGENLNEVVIEPAQVPTDPATLRASIPVSVSQNCNPTETPVETPDTGLFDEVLVQVGIGLLVLLLGWLIYSKPFGHVIVNKLVNSGLYKEAEMTSWKLFKPKKFFEEKTIKRMKKRI